MFKKLLAEIKEDDYISDQVINTFIVVIVIAIVLIVATLFNYGFSETEKVNVERKADLQKQYQQRGR